MDLVKTWRKDGFTLRLYDTFKTDPMGHNLLAYEFKDGKKTIFKGDRFGCPAGVAIDSLKCVYALLGFLSLGKGDTDADYFEDYTQAQLDWRDSNRREHLAMIVFEWEERQAKKRR